MMHLIPRRQSILIQITFECNIVSQIGTNFQLSNVILAYTTVQCKLPSSYHLDIGQCEDAIVPAGVSTN